MRATSGDATEMPSSEGKIDMETSAEPNPVRVCVKAEMSMTSATIKNTIESCDKVRMPAKHTRRSFDCATGAC